MRLFTSVLASVAMLFAASTASALVFVATTSVGSGNPLTALVPGDVVTINIRMSNPDPDQIFGVGGGIQGWDESVASFTSGQMNVGPYFCTNAGCTTGLGNSLPFTLDPETELFYSAGPEARQNIGGVGNYVPIVQAISTTGRLGTGVRDPGIDGVVDGGDAQFRVVFTVTGPGTTTIDIGTNANPTLGNVVALAGGVSEQATNALITLTVVPEPGTALLMGLGLAGLAAAGRRR